MGQTSELITIEPTNLTGYDASYRGVPNEIAQQCEACWAQAQTAYDLLLESLVAVRNLLASYGCLKSWCAGHGLNYSSVASALSRKYGKRTIDASSTESLPDPELDEDGAVAEPSAPSVFPGAATIPVKHEPRYDGSDGQDPEGDDLQLRLDLHPLLRAAEAAGAFVRKTGNGALIERWAFRAGPQTVGAVVVNLRQAAQHFEQAAAIFEWNVMPRPHLIAAPRAAESLATGEGVSSESRE